MNNKLSELSKPVAEVVSKFGDLEAFGEREIKLLTGIQQMAYGTKFYSQEYVSALLAELEVVTAENALFRETGDYLIQAAYCAQERANEAEKRLPVLEQDKLQLNEIINSEANRADAAEKQLVYSRDAIATWERKAISNFEECAKMSQCIEELEKRLATPVRLPDSRQCVSGDRYQWSDGVHNYRKDTIATLREQGFNCVEDL